MEDTTDPTIRQIDFLLANGESWQRIKFLTRRQCTKLIDQKIQEQRLKRRTVRARAFDAAEKFKAKWGL